MRKSSVKNKHSKEHILLYKILFSAIILTIYIIGRRIPLAGIDITSYQVQPLDAESFFTQSMSGDFQDCSIFILGLWPYMIASIFAMIVTAIMSADKVTRISTQKMNHITLAVMMIIAIVQAFMKVNSFSYLNSDNIIVNKIIVFIELIAGMALVVFLCDYCQKYGIGGKTSVFLANIYSGIYTMMSGIDIRTLVLPIAIGIVEAIIILILENTEKHIAVQRVTILSIYADKNYIAYKFIPVGIMPIMFASAFFMLVKLIFNGLSFVFPNNFEIANISNSMSLNSQIGVVTYLAIIFLLNIGFSLITILPSKTADSLLKTGDCLEDIYPGKPTKRYLVASLFRISLFSSIVMCVFIAVPFYLQFRGIIDEKLVMLPSSIMMSVGLWLQFFREAEVYRNLENYKTII